VSSETASALLARHEQLPARAGAAAQVLRLADDPDTSAQQLARAVGTDPVLAAKTLRVANSPYYGLGGRVGTLPFAVSVVGFQAVRSLAVVAAAGLDDPGAVPEGFWQSAALVATAGELLAGHLDADPGDAFSVGLLHTLGAALLHQQGPSGTVCLPEPEDTKALLTREREQHGMAHDELGARVLAAWHVPERVCVLVGRHHEPLLPEADALERTLCVARLLADRALRGKETTATSDRMLTWLTEGRLTPADTPDLLHRVEQRAQALLQGLQAG
jgi:HD-like signal output (HDOD) protein